MKELDDCYVISLFMDYIESAAMLKHHTGLSANEVIKLSSFMQENTSLKLMTPSDFNDISRKYGI